MRCMSSLPTECPDMVSPECPEYRVMPAEFQGIRYGVQGISGIQYGVTGMPGSHSKPERRSQRLSSPEDN
jgi:hypothetical protein